MRNCLGRHTSVQGADMLSESGAFSDDLGQPLQSVHVHPQQKAETIVVLFDGNKD